MSQAKSGDTVRFHFTGSLTDGTVFASSEGQDPMSITLGTEAVLPDIDAALIGMAAGDKATVEIAADKGYGQRQQEMIYDVERDKFPPDLDLQAGMALEAAAPDGSPLVIQIVAVEGDKVTVDENHPLAGQDLKFEIEMVDIA